MELGGNLIVNSIFEATNVEGSTKLDARADATTREQYVREKYKYRKFYNAAAYSDVGKASEDNEKESNTQAVPTPRQCMMRRQSSMPAIHATSKTPLSIKFDGDFTKMNASEHFEANWDALPSCRGGLRKARSHNDKRDELSLSWHPESPQKKKKG
jgi:hypothetical protein